MFRRRKTELEEVKPTMEKNDDLGLPERPATRPGAGLGSGKAPVLPTQPPRPTDTVRPGIEMPRQTPAAAPAPRHSETEHRKLIVGREIALSGEITSCDRLVVEGSVEANLARGQSGQLPRRRHCRERSLQGLGFDRGGRDPRPLRGHADGAQAVVDSLDWQSRRHGALRPDRDRSRRSTRRRHPGLDVDRDRRERHHRQRAGAGRGQFRAAATIGVRNSSRIASLPRSRGGQGGVSSESYAAFVFALKRQRSLTGQDGHAGLRALQT